MNPTDNYTFEELASKSYEELSNIYSEMLELVAQNIERRHQLAGKIMFYQNLLIKDNERQDND